VKFGWGKQERNEGGERRRVCSSCASSLPPSSSLPPPPNPIPSSSYLLNCHLSQGFWGGEVGGSGTRGEQGGGRWEESREEEVGMMRKCVLFLGWPRTEEKEKGKENETKKEEKREEKGGMIRERERERERVREGVTKRARERASRDFFCCLGDHPERGGKGEKERGGKGAKEVKTEGWGRNLGIRQLKRLLFLGDDE
jgi:hypothetical protein